MLPLLLSAAFAQEAPADRSRLPSVAVAVEPVHPAQALEQGISSQVLLALQIDATGRVLAAEVVESGGPDFDDAAVQALLATTFVPALDAQGEPAAAAIYYRVVFDVQAAPPLRMQGQATLGQLPLSGVRIRGVGPEGAQARAVSDSEGRYALVGLEPGPWVFLVEAEGMEPIVRQVEIDAESVVSLDLAFQPQRAAELGDEPGEVLVVQAARLTPDITERRLSAEEIAYLPGSSGDVVKAVQNLPGIARAPLGIGQLIVRGNDAGDTTYTLDGSPIPLVFHFAGLTSVVPGQALDEVAYLPGNYGVRYGRTLGGVVDLRTTRQLPLEPNRSISVDLYQSAAFIQQPIGDRAAVTVAARRSYADAVLGPLLNNVDGLKVQAPRYYDAQLRFQYQGDEGDWDVLLFASDDRFRFLGLSEEEEDELTLAAFADQFQRVRVRHLSTVRGWELENTVAFGPEKRFFEFGEDSDALEERLTVSARQEWVRPLTPDRSLGARVGLDLLGGQEGFNFYVQDFGPREKDSARFVAPALYGELSWRVGPLTLIPGLRADLLAYDSGYTATAIDPRIAARVRIGDGAALKASYGRYSAFPTLREVSGRADGNPELGPQQSLQASVGWEQQLPWDLTLETTLFYNQLSQLVVGREDRLEFFTGPPPVGPFDTDAYANDGVGLACGAELMLRYDGPKTVGLLTGTFSHSQRQDRPDEEVELFAFDQPIVLNALVSRQLPRRWRLGARYRFGSGNPYTPVVNRYYDASFRAYIPVYGERSSGRLPYFTSLDLRVDKEFTLRTVQMTAFLELQNATNRANVEVVGWNADYSAQDNITGYPTLPVFGFKGAW